MLYHLHNQLPYDTVVVDSDYHYLSFCQCNDGNALATLLCGFAPQRSVEIALRIACYIIASFALETSLMSALRVHLSFHHA